MHHWTDTSLSLKVTSGPWNIPGQSQTYSSLNNAYRKAAISAAVLQTCIQLEPTTYVMGSQLCDAFAQFLTNSCLLQSTESCLQIIFAWHFNSTFHYVLICVYMHLRSDIDRIFRHTIPLNFLYKQWKHSE